MDTDMGMARGTDASTADERCAAWVAKGAVHERKTKQRVGLGLWVAIVFLFG
jgi:hypothetical protein